VNTPTNILLPTDFSEASSAAQRYAVMLAETFDATLHVLHVLADPLALGWGADIIDLPHVVERARGTVLGQLEETFSSTGPTTVRTQFAVEVGTPTAKILEYARDKHISLIVMGTHGRSVLERMWLGSVTQGVLHRAPCPVVSVQQPRE